MGRIGRHPSVWILLICLAAGAPAPGVRPATASGGAGAMGHRLETGTTAQEPETGASTQDDAAGATGSTDDNKPRGQVTPDLIAPPAGPGFSLAEVWYGGGAAPRGGETLLYDNGPPLEAYGDPATQLSLAADGAAGVWQFRATTADDFIIEDFVQPDTAARITRVLAPFALFNPSTPGVTPLSVWTQGVYVVIWPNNPTLNIPFGAPLINPTNPNATTPNFLNAVGFNLVPTSAMTQTLVDDICRPCYMIDIPVDLVVAKNTTYWLAIIPRHPAPPQSAWCLSDESTGRPGHWGFEEIGISFWEVIPGNTTNFQCPSAPPAGSRKDLSFQLFGEDATVNIACCNEATGVCRDILPPESCFSNEVEHVGTFCQFINCQIVTGACCNDATSGCANGVAEANCQGANQRFAPGQTCAQLTPPCGTTGLGACCLPSGLCSELTPVECTNAGGDWNQGTCGTVLCPPPNDICVDATVITADGLYPFSTIGAVTDGDPDSPGGPCTNVNQDVWFRYIASCDGVLFLSTCFQTNYDSAINVYQGCFCDQNQGPLVACNNNGCDQGGGSTTTLPVQQGGCYLIRVGGAGTATGTGTLAVGCVPVNQGACCLPAGSCELVDATACQGLGGEFNQGEPCSPAVCPAPENDNCFNALQIEAGIHRFNTANATTDGPGGPLGGDCDTIDKDVWYSFTATCDGTLVASLCGATNFDAAIAVYTGCTCPPGQPPAGCNNDGCGAVGGAGRVSIAATAGQCYLIRLGGNDGDFGEGELFVECIPVGQGACCLADTTCEVRTQLDCGAPDEIFVANEACLPGVCPEPPPNDDCGNAVEINNGITLFSTIRATTDGPDDSPGAPCNDVNQDVWFRYTATCSGEIVVNLCLNTNYDASLALYNGFACPPAAAPIVCDDDACGATGGPGRVRTAVTAGQQILIRVGGPGTASGEGAIIIGCIPANEGACCLPPDQCLQTDAVTCVGLDGDFVLGEPCSPVACPGLVNDDCDDAIVVLDGDMLFDTTDATTDGPLDSPGGICTQVENDAWFLYTATCSGILKISLCSATTFDAAIAVYDVCSCPPPVPPAACDNDACAGPESPSEVQLLATQGTCYLIRVGGHNGARGSGTLTITCTEADLCCKGDANIDNVLDELDAAALVPLLLDPPLPDDPGYCQADVNGDDAVDGLDVVEFVERLLTGVVCPPINQPTGACCFADGDCSEETQANCLSLDGGYSGNGTDCTPNNCPQPNDPPANDACTSAINMACNSSDTFDNTAGAPEPGDPPFSCRAGGEGQGVGTVWYTFTAEGDSALITTCNTTGGVTNTLIAVYPAGCPTSSQDEIACNDDAGGACPAAPGLSRLCVDGLTPGNVYTIQVASYDDASRGDITVDLRCPCPVGACCYADATCEELRDDECAATGGSYKGDDVTCDSQTCPPLPALSCCGGDMNGDGIIDDADAADFAAALLVPPMLGTPAYCRADTNGDGDINGVDIQLFVGAATVGAECGPPDFDECTESGAIACGQRVLVENTYATTVGGDPAFSCLSGGPGQGVNTIWLSFVATETTAYIRTCDSLPPATDTLLAVYDGSCPLLAADEIGCSDDGSLVCGPGLSELCVSGLVVGNTYYIQAASADIASRGFISVELQCACP